MDKLSISIKIFLMEILFIFFYIVFIVGGGTGIMLLLILLSPLVPLLFAIGIWVAGIKCERAEPLWKILVFLNAIIFLILAWSLWIQNPISWR